MQLVLSNNRIIAHGENFLAMGGVVINTVSGKKYENATIAECGGNCPSDIDEVGYEYHAGAFIPCAPYGKAPDGTILVGCEDCKTPKDSGILISSLTKCAYGSYVGTGTFGEDDPVTLTFDDKPKAVQIYSGGILMYTLHRGVTSFIYVAGSTNYTINVTWSENSVSWYSATIHGAANTYDATYHYIAHLVKGE